MHCVRTRREAACSGAGGGCCCCAEAEEEEEESVDDSFVLLPAHAAQLGASCRSYPCPSVQLVAAASGVQPLGARPTSATSNEALVGAVRSACGAAHALLALETTHITTPGSVVPLRYE